MRKKKKFGLFEKLTGSIHMDDFDDEIFEDEKKGKDDNLYETLDEEDSKEYYDEEDEFYDDEETSPAQGSLIHRIEKTPPSVPRQKIVTSLSKQQPEKEKHEINNSLPDHDAEIPIDIIETTDTIYVRTEITGIDPDNVDIDLTRDTLVLTATKKERRVFGEDEYSHKEIYWGDVGRSIDLPDEVEVEEAEAHAEFGILLITLPKIDKARKTKLRVGVKKKNIVKKI